MTAIPDELIEQVRDTADLVHVLGDFVELRRTGADYRGPCPFHGGTHRNFAVIPKKQMFYCFVCHEGGDVFTFFMKKFGMDYPTAVRDVAGRVGIVIPERSTGGPDPREPYYSAVAVAGEWFAERLRDAPDAEPARRYLAGRGFDLETLHPLGIGFAPKGAAFLEAMAKLGIGEEILVETGLAVHRDNGSLRPRFWGRLLFPIHDIRGRVVGFGGRILGDGEPKYLNSPETQIFHKGRLLYNLHNAKHAIRRAERALVVEGYFDVLRAVEAGVEHVVAPLGTALTAEQAALLKRYTKEVILLYDSDKAGLRASFRAADELLRVSIRPMIATPPPGEDPDTLVVKGGADALAGVLDDAIDAFERKLQLIERKGWLGSLAGRRRALDRLLGTLRAAEDPVTRDLYVDRAASTLGVTADSIRREMESAPSGAGRRVSAAAPAPDEARPPSVGGSGPERLLLAALVHEPRLRPQIAEVLAAATGLSPASRAVLEAVAHQPETVVGGDLLMRLDGAARTLVATLLQEPWSGQDLDAVAKGAFNKLESRRLESELGELERRLPMVPEGEKIALLSEIDTRRRQIAKLNPGRWNVLRMGRSSAV